MPQPETPKGPYPFDQLKGKVVRRHLRLFGFKECLFTPHGWIIGSHSECSLPMVHLFSALILIVCIHAADTASNILIAVSLLNTRVFKRYRTNSRIEILFCLGSHVTRRALYASFR